MAEALRLPRMSDTMEEGVIAEILIKVGDTLKTGDVIAEVETDKATMEWESFQEGKVLHLAVGNGDTVPINGIVAVIGKDGEDYQAILDEKADDSSDAANSENENDDAQSEENESALETSKEDNTENIVEFEMDAGSGDRIKASPLAKKIAEEKGININDVKGTGDDGRIVKKDIEAYTPKEKTSSENPAAQKHIEEKPKAAPIELPTIVAEESYTEEKTSQVRKVIAKRLSESMFTAPHFYLTIDVNLNKTIAARKEINAVAPTKISFNDFVIKATANAIRKNPLVNTSWMGDTIRHNKHIHIGMAVATDFGLVVPVIKFADNKSLSHISAEAKQFAAKARDRKLTPEEMQGHTFSISNLGSFGISDFTAVINPPDSCILAVGGINKVLAYDENKNIVENNMMRLTLSCDHRTVDGAVGSVFLQDLKQFLENPVMMLV